MVNTRIWKFLPSKEREQEFAREYSPGGRWAELFGRANGYRGTTLLRPIDAAGSWITLDRWDSERDFEAFSRDFGDDYRSLDRELEGVAGEEDFIGAFEEQG